MMTATTILKKRGRRRRRRRRSFSFELEEIQIHFLNLGQSVVRRERVMCARDSGYLFRRFYKVIHERDETTTKD
jgi:hypothetical protein